MVFPIGYSSNPSYVTTAPHSGAAAAATAATNTTNVGTSGFAVPADEFFAAEALSKSAASATAATTYPPDRKYKLSEASAKDKVDWDFMFNSKIASDLKNLDHTVTEIFVTKDKKFSVINATNAQIIFERRKDSSAKDVFAIEFNGLFLTTNIGGKHLLLAKEINAFQDGEKFLFVHRIFIINKIKTDTLCIYNVQAGKRNKLAMGVTAPSLPHLEFHVDTLDILN